MCPYDPEWVASFERQRQLLEPILAQWLVQPLEHIGSTAVPGLVAKPIIDIVAVVENITDVAAAQGALREIGWVFAPEPADESERRLSFCTPSEEQRTHHLHIVERSFPEWRGWIAFRNYLRKNPMVAQEYGELKTHLANEHGSDPNQRGKYRAGKSDWVRAVTSVALSEES
jgi:GrpB-like predicted nucleotidyltransferase (UPF0157 family)